MSAAALSSSGFNERVLELLDRLEYRRAVSDVEREAIFRLRYEAYVREGALAPNASERLTDRFEDLPNAHLFGIYINGKLASSIRVHVSTPATPLTPAVDAFRDILGPDVDAGRTIVDPNRFVADYACSRTYPELPYVTVRLGYVACAHFQADIGIATARLEHQAFYRRFMMLRPMCEPRPYPTLLKPLSLMAIHYPSVREPIEQRYPFFRSTYAEREALFTPARNDHFADFRGFGEQKAPMKVGN